MSLQITIKNATNLPRTREGGRGKINPYFKVNFVGQVYQTQIFRSDLNPNFNETFTFNDSPAKDQLVFELYDDNQNGTSELISQYIISSDALPTGIATLPLSRLNTNTPSGQVNIEIVHIAPPPGMGHGRGSQPFLPPTVGRGNVVITGPPAVVVTPPPAVVLTPPPAVVVVPPVSSQKSLQITIISAQNLPVLSTGGGRKGKADKIDPFIKVTFGKQLYQTKIFQDELNPRFNETFTFQDPPKRDKVVFELYDNGSSQLIATYVLDADKIPTGKATLPLQTPQGVACGQIDIEVVHLANAPGPQVVVQPQTTVVVQGGPQKVIVQAAPQKGRK